MPLQPLAAIQPMDLMTSVGDSPIEITIVPRGTTVDDAFLNGVRNRIALATWPEMAAVGFDVSILNETAPKQLDNGALVAPRALLRVQPAKPLDDRWYVVSLNAQIWWRWHRSKHKRNSQMARWDIGSGRDPRRPYGACGLRLKGQMR